MQSQKTLLANFRAVTKASERVAKDCLKKHEWNLDRAINFFFTHRSSAGKAATSSSSKAARQKLNEIFKKYENPEDRDVMCGDNLQQYFHDINVDPNARESLAVLFVLRARNMGVVSRDEFISGWEELGCFSLKLMQKQVDVLKTQLEDRTTFSDFYKWLFDHLKEDDKKRTLPLDLGLQVWTLVFKRATMPLLEPFSLFLEQNEVPVFSKDLWVQSHEFLRDTASDLHNYDREGAWPSLIDDFVASYEKTLNDDA